MTALVLAVLAPAQGFGATPPAARTNPVHPAAAVNGSSASIQGDPGLPIDEGTTQLPAMGDTQVPATPDTPRPHYTKPPAHQP